MFFARSSAAKIAFFLQENLHAHKIPRFRGAAFWFFFFFGGGGGSADFIFMGARTFLTCQPEEKEGNGKVLAASLSADIGDQLLTVREPPLSP